MGENEKKEFHFINEQIKKKPFYRRKWFTQGGSGDCPGTYFRGGGGRDVRDRTAVGEQSVWKAG